MQRYKRYFTERSLPKIGSVVRLGKKRKESVWNSKMKPGTKMIVLAYDKLLADSNFDNEEAVLSLAFLDEYQSEDFDPEMDYQIVYLDEIRY
ncbi:MAG: hypothetical protein BWY36_00998 [Candidatus Diapherotrites archaeon ADurb.Bin253]|jgi:hypothetical protein|nr:MAG: hypothetical protein BWY36_00998 [Candidatus Diapherotrites archaeon ADurb.Bin253]